MVVIVKCSCCRQRLFDLETADLMGRERIKIKCPRCKKLAVIQPKNYRAQSK